jgi:hypothetical protein
VFKVTENEKWARAAVRKMLIQVLLVGAGVDPPVFAGEDAGFGEGQSRSAACKDEATMAP